MNRTSVLPLMNAVRLQDAVLCAECETITDSDSDVCLACGCTSLLNLARILGGTIERHARLANVEEFPSKPRLAA